VAARRLLIVLLVLLGVSTLAAALVPQGTLNEGDTTSTTTTQATTTAPTASPNPAFLRPTKITVGGKKFPVVSPIHVGDQLRLLVRSRFPAEIEIPEFGLLGFASPDAPARFELLPETPGTFGILFADSRKPAGQIEVVAPAGTGQSAKKGEKGKKGEEGKGPKSRAPAGSDRA
jgi:hypothetical protein